MIKTVKNLAFALREANAVSKFIIPFMTFQMAIATTLTLMRTFLYKYLADYALSESFQIKTATACLLGFFLIDCAYYAVVNPLSELFLARYEIRFKARNMSMIYQKCTKLDLAAFNQKEFYDKLDRAINESENRYFLILTSLITFTCNGLSLVFVFSFYRDIFLILALLVYVALYMTYYVIQTRKDYEFLKRENPFYRYEGYLQRVFSDRDYALEFRATPGSADILQRKYAQNFDSFFARFLKHENAHAGRGILLNYLSAAVIFLVASIYVTSLLLNRAITPGDFLVLIGIVGDMGTKLTNLLSALPELHQSALYVSEIREVLDYPTSLDNDEEKAAVDSFTSLEFQNVSFRYGDEGTFALHDLSFSLRRGEIVALVGLNGAGKSTIVDCIMGLLSPDGGQILLNGRDYGEYRMADVHALFGAVFQDFQIYQLSVAENVLMRRVQSEEDIALVHEALRYAGLYEKILSLEDGIDTIMSAGGVLSGGEEQMLAIARAYAKDAPFILFDEPTSALDVYMTNHFYEKMFRLREERGKTILFTSHKLKHVHRADKIIFMEDGTAAECGSHEELIGRDSRYAELCRLRTVDFFEEEAL